MLVVKIHSHSPFVFSFFFSPPFLFSCAWRLSPQLNHPTTLDTNTRPSSKMPRHGINDKVTLAGAPAPPTLSWRLNCDKTPLFSPERRRRGYQKEGGGGGRKKRLEKKQQEVRRTERWRGEKKGNAGERVDFGLSRRRRAVNTAWLRSRSFCLYEGPINDDQQGK